jgi:hypothetical protein
VDPLERVDYRVAIRFYLLGAFHVLLRILDTGPAACYNPCMALLT